MATRTSSKSGPVPALPLPAPVLGTILGTILVAIIAPRAVSGADDLGDAMAVLDHVETTVTGIDHRSELLAVVVDELAHKLGVTVRADWPALLDLGVSPRDQITLSFDRAAGSTVLSALAMRLGDQYGRPVWEVHASEIVLTTVEGTAAMRLTDVYDVRDILADGQTMSRLREAVPPWMDELRPAAGPGDGDGGEADDSEPSRPQDPEQVPRPLSPGEELLYLIVDHVDPDAWIDFGGTRGKISERDGVLLVTVAPTTHRRLRDALRRLRSTDPASVHLEAAIVDVPDARVASIGRRHDRGSRGYGRGLLLAADAAVLWRSSTTVASGHPMKVESTSGATTVTLSLTPQTDAGAGLLHLEVLATTVHGDDRRQVRTGVSIPSRGAAVIELPASAPTGVRRLLVIVPER